MRTRGKRNRLRREGGFVLITVYWLVTFLVIFAVAGVTYALADLRASQRLQANLQAFYLAEAGIDQAIVHLRPPNNYVGTANFSGPVGTSGTYSVQVEDLGGNRRRLTSPPLATTPVQRRLEAVVQKLIPPGFYNNTIWSSQDLDFKGNAYTVIGDVRYGGRILSGTTGLQGTVTYDPASNPLPRLSFQELYNIATAQGNVYDATRLAGGPGIFPHSFWYSPPTDPNNPATGVPNVNYVTTDLVLNGTIGTVGGFFVVVGNVLTDPNAVEDTTLNGNGQIDGAVYTTGNFRVNGGGGGLNVNGGIWAGNGTRLNGKVTLSYNTAYMDSLKSLGINADVQLISWRDF